MLAVSRSARGRIRSLWGAGDRHHRFLVGFGDFASGASFVQYGGSVNADTDIVFHYCDECRIHLRCAPV